MWGVGGCWGIDSCDKKSLLMEVIVMTTMRETMTSAMPFQDKYGDTPLHDAIARQNTVMVDLLLQLDNINVRLVNRKGYTPLQLACRVQNTE